MYKIFSIFLLFIPMANFAQSQVVVREVSGSVQYKLNASPSWSPITAGLKINEKNYIRLNTPNSMVTLSLSDGGTLRLIGIGSFYIDYLARILNDNRQHKIFNISGRWYFDSSTDMPSRLIVNSEITTSVIENGSGGGFFYNGTNELLIQKGRGLSSYRQKDALAIVVESKQYIDFNIYDGFNYPKLATPEIFAKYLVLDPIAHLERAQQNFVSLDINSYTSGREDFVVADRTRMSASLSPRLKKVLANRQIRMNQLKVLEDLSYQTNNTIVKVNLSTQSFLPTQKTKNPLVPVVINTAQLPELNLEEFAFTTNDITDNTKKANTPKKRSSAVSIPNRKRAAVKAIKREKKSQNAKDIVVQNDEQAIDVDELLNSIAERAARDNAKNRVAKKNTGRRPTAKVITESITNEPPKPKPVARKPKPKPKPAPVIEEPIIEEIQEEAYYYEPEPEPEQSYAQWELPQREAAQADASFFQDRNNDDPLYQYDQFSIDSAEDLLNSEFSKVLFDI